MHGAVRRVTGDGLPRCDDIVAMAAASLEEQEGQQRGTRLPAGEHVQDARQTQQSKPDVRATVQAAAIAGGMAGVAVVADTEAGVIGRAPGIDGNSDTNWDNDPAHKQGEDDAPELMGVGMEAAMEVIQGGGSSSEAAAAAAAAVTSAGGEEADAIAAAGTAAAFTAAMKGLSAQDAAVVAAAAATAAGGSHLDAASAAGAAASSVVSALGGSAAEASEAAADAQAKLGLLEDSSRKRCRANAAGEQPSDGVAASSAAPAAKRRCFSAEELHDPASLPLETDDETLWLRGEALLSVTQLHQRYFTTKKKRHRWGTGPSLRWAYKSDPYEKRCLGCKACIRWQTAIAGDATGMPQYEVFNADHIKALAQYFVARMDELGLPALSVVEVGAGDGRFSHFLRVALAKSGVQGADKVTVTATDDNSRQLEQFYAVETCDAVEVMNRFKPDIVLVSWMELGQDWTSSFRACPSVQEYVLVGEVDNGACGHPWKTWGHSFISAASSDALEDADKSTGNSAAADELEAREKQVAPYVAEGFRRMELEELSALQLNHFDEPWQKHMPHFGPDGQLQPWRSWSRTVSFRRLKLGNA